MPKVCWPSLSGNHITHHCTQHSDLTSDLAAANETSFPETAFGQFGTDLDLQLTLYNLDLGTNITSSSTLLLGCAVWLIYFSVSIFWGGEVPG